jgi:MFS family permease
MQLCGKTRRWEETFMQVTDSPPDAGRPEPVVTAKTWGFVLFLMLLNVFNILDRQLLPTFAPDIIRDLGISKGQFGLLTGIMFVLLYGLLSPFMGLIADNTHRPRFVALGVGIWSLLTAASGAARNFVSMAFPRVFIGVGESTLSPTALSMIADRFPSRRLGIASGLYYAGVPLGSGLAYFVASILAPKVGGWRNCFYILGAIGLVLALIMAFQKETRARKTDTGGIARAIGNILALIPDVILAMRRSPALLMTMLGGVGIHLAVGGAQFDTLWWKEDLGLDTGPLFLKVALMYATVGVAGNVLGGYLGDLWLRKTGLGRPMFVAVLLIVTTPFGLLYRLTDHAGWMFWIGVGSGIFQLGAMYGSAFSTIQELVPERMRATAIAIFIMMLNVVGLGLSVTIGGFMIDAFTKAAHARPITDMMLVMTAASAIAIPAFLIAAFRFSKDRDALNAFEAEAANAGTH